MEARDNQLSLMLQQGKETARHKVVKSTQIHHCWQVEDWPRQPVSILLPMSSLGLLKRLYILSRHMPTT